MSTKFFATEAFEKRADRASQLRRMVEKNPALLPPTRVLPARSKADMKDHLRARIMAGHNPETGDNTGLLGRVYPSAAQTHDIDTAFRPKPGQTLFRGVNENQTHMPDGAEVHWSNNPRFAAGYAHSPEAHLLVASAPPDAKFFGPARALRQRAGLSDYRFGHGHDTTTQDALSPEQRRNYVGGNTLASGNKNTVETLLPNTLPARAYVREEVPHPATGEPIVRFRSGNHVIMEERSKRYSRFYRPATGPHNT